MSSPINFPDNPDDGQTFGYSYNGLTQNWVYKTDIPGWISQGFGITQGTQGNPGAPGPTGATGIVGVIEILTTKYSDFNTLSFAVAPTSGNFPSIGATLPNEDLTITHYIPNRNISFYDLDNNELLNNPDKVIFKTTGDLINLSSLTSDSGITFDFSVSIPDSYNVISSVRQENTQKATKVSNLNFIGGSSDTFYDLELSVTQQTFGGGLTQANIAYYLPKRVIVQINGNSGGSNNIWDYSGLETSFSKSPNTTYNYNLRNMFEAGNSADSAYGLPSQGNTFTGFTGFALRAVPAGTFVEVVAKDGDFYYFAAPNPIDGSC